jgi:hypothetical protein
MPLIRYFQYITYPDGNPAGDVTLPVWLLGGNQPVPLFADKSGLTPAPNPTTTAGDGLLDVYAAPGPLTVELAGEIFPLLVHPDEPDVAWPNTFVHTQSVAASVWTVAHHFGIQPAVTNLVSSEPVNAEISHPDDETTVITFSAPTSGTAHLRR